MHQQGSSDPVMPNVDGFILVEKLGSGTYATVYKAYRKSNQHREVVAIKCIKMSRLGKAASDNLVQEIGILKSMKHRHIVDLKDFMYDKNYVYLVMEYCSGGDLSAFIRSERSLPENIVREFLQQLASALQFLRSKDISHMDLKPQNILLTSLNKPILKLADFGFAQHLSDEEKERKMKGSPLYMAPEMICKRKYNARADLWSVGVIMYECLFGRAPFASRTFDELAEKILDGRPVDIPCGVRISQSCRDLLHKLLQRDPDVRISFEEFFRHSFVDLEHMPSSTCLDKAIHLVNQAVEADKKSDLKAAVTLYCKALEYFVPALKFQKDEEKKCALRKKVKSYMDRAEQIKESLKPNVIDHENKPYETLISMCDDNMKLQAALQLANGAEYLEETEQFEVASEKYQLALSNLLEIAQQQPKCKRKDLLYIEINRWMSRAEHLKSYLYLKNLNTDQTSIYNEDDVGRDSFLSRQQCSIQ